MSSHRYAAFVVGILAFWTMPPLLQTSAGGDLVTSETPPAVGSKPKPPTRTETFSLESWRVTCRDDGDRSRRQCLAVLALSHVQSGRRQTLGAWIVRRDDTGALVSQLQLPMFQTARSSAGISIAKGVDFKLNNASARHLRYSLCDVQGCEAVMPMDDATKREVAAATSTAITIYGKDGTALTINVPSIGGIDKALETVAR